MAAERVVRVSGPNPSLTVSSSRGTVTLMVGAAVLFVAVGVWMILRSDELIDTAMGVVVVAVFGIAVLLGGWQLTRSGPALLVNHSGITDRSSVVSVGFVAWTEITGMGISTSRGAKTLNIGVTEPDKVLARANTIARAVLRVSMWITGTPVNIPTTTLPFSADQLLTELMAFAPPTLPGTPERRG